MSTHEKKTFYATYEWAKTWHDLPWAHGEPTLFLAEICERRKPGRVLDIGCGAGTDSVYLAKRGWDVTSLDFMPKAFELTQGRAKEAGVSVTLVEADITEWVVPKPFDLVLDHGLLHNMNPLRYRAYRERVLDAIADDGDFVLLHWHPRYPGQPSGRMGPLRASREDLLKFFAPDLQERFFAREEFEDLPELVGGGMSQAYFWLRRNRAHSHPTELVDQVRATFQRNGMDVDAILAKAGDAPVNAKVASTDLLAKLVGPGRFGLSHAQLSPGDADALLKSWAERAGQNPRTVANLFTLFTSSEHGDLCGAVPKCAQCEVHICKRLRYR